MNKEYRRGLRTQPCGTPVFREIVEEERLCNLTDWGLLVRKSRVECREDVVC